MLFDPVIGRRPADDGIAEPGMAVTVRYDDGGLETVLLSHDDDQGGTVTACSPDSPLGRALHGAREGEYVRYPLPGDGTGGCLLLRVAPYNR
ncbi:MULTISPECIES: GreA/GreB family elongation factor [unclassified Pseudonocardia]|uniref:GreA/GreB family elongation factor n=1 Tax=unclassified Pseudonocardia TaxID=2619320 RepID=UPI0007610A5A|nr:MULTISPECIES: GreA/GreB family elongation factor [unclassified Pseudonocardia]